MTEFDAFAETLEIPQHRALFDYWRAKAPPGKLPGRADIDPIEIPKLLPWLILYDVVWQDDGRPRFRFRLVGTGNVERYGRDATGLWFEEAYSGATLARQQAVFSEVAITGRPHRSDPTLPTADREYLTYHRLILPLARDGKTVDNLIALMVFDEDKP